MLLSKFIVGDTVVCFDAPVDSKGAPQLLLYPKALPPVKHREFLPPDVELVGLPSNWQPIRAWSLDALVQLKCMEDIYGGSFSQGRTMRSGHSTAVLEFISQKVHRENGETSVITALQHPSGLHFKHHLS
jgi:hypothetical protein